MMIKCHQLQYSPSIYQFLFKEDATFNVPRDGKKHPNFRNVKCEEVVHQK